MDMEFLTKIFAASHETAAAARWLPWAMLGFALVFGYAYGWASRSLRAKVRWERFVIHNCRAFISYRRHLPAEAADLKEHLAHQAACLVVLSKAIVQARVALGGRRSQDPEAERLFQLMDAIHNLPSAAAGTPALEKAFVIDALARYDALGSAQTESAPSPKCLLTIYRDAFSAQLAASEASGDAAHSHDTVAAASRAPNTIRGAFRSLPHNQRRVLSLVAVVSFVAFVSAVGSHGTRPHHYCDETMFTAAHPQLAAIGDSPEALVRRFVVLMREVSASDDCNERGLREALTHASTAVLDKFLHNLEQAGTIDHFFDRRHSELVSVDLQVEPRSATAWDLHWTEQVRSPAGVLLRTEEYGGELRASKPNSTADTFEVADFQVRAVAQPYGAR